MSIPQHISLPRGCAAAATQLLGEHRISLKIEDERQLGSPLELEFNGDLTRAQSEAARALLEHDTGMFVGPPGIGKTVLGTYLVAKRARSTLIIVHRRPLLEQWVAQLAMFLGIDEKQIVAVCRSGRTRHSVPILELLLPNPRPAGAEWIEAYRSWAVRG